MYNNGVQQKQMKAFKNNLQLYWETCCHMVKHSVLQFASVLTFECKLVKDEAEFQPVQIMRLISLHNI